MKLFKSLFCICTLSFILSTGIVLASDLHSFINVKMPSFSKIYNSVDKTRNSSDYQQIYTSDAIDSITGGGRAVEVRSSLKATSSGGRIVGPWTSAPKGTLKNITDSNTYGIFRVDLRASKSTFATVRYWGEWYY